MAQKPTYVPTTYMNGQQGGFAILPIAAAALALHKGLETFKPFSRANKALQENVPDSKKDNIFYKIANKITGVGKSLGYGEKKKRRRHKKKK